MKKKKKKAVKRTLPNPKSVRCEKCGHPLAGECPDSPLTNAVLAAAMRWAAMEMDSEAELQSACVALLAARSRKT